MTDREKVVIGLKCLITDDVPCDGCPYYGSGYCIINIASDAITLLKEREPVKPIRINTNFEQSWKCGECGGLVNTHFKYCPYCGRSLRWGNECTNS